MSVTTDQTEFVEGVITTIPLDRLMLSSLNVRQTARDADVESLAEDIAARGLKQNLVVVPAHFVSGEATDDQMTGEPRKSGGKAVWEGRFEVIAGGRRFQAMQRLVASDRLSPTFPVSCMVEERAAASETSLSENLHRVAMNPADEFEAFRIIVEKFGSDDVAVGLCAKRFGVTVKHVQGRLRLASLAPAILEALRANEIGLDSAKAYAGVEDQALQLKVFAAQNKSSWQPHSPAQVRAALRGETRACTDPLVKFVGIDAYVAAGGRIETEMFMGTEGEERVADVKLLEKLAREIAEPMVAPQAKKDGFKEGLLVKGLDGSSTWPKAPEGMERFIRYYQDKDPTKAELKRSVAVYAIAQDGIGLQKLGHFRPIPKREPAPERDWEAERAASERERKIERRAAQLAVYEIGKFAGTPFEGRAFWPARTTWPVQEDDQDENFALVAVLIRMPVADIEAQKAEAERLLDEEAAAAEAEQEAEAQRREEIDSKLDAPEAQEGEPR